LDGLDEVGPGRAVYRDLVIMDVEVEALEPGLVVEPAGRVVAVGVGLAAVRDKVGGGADQARMVGVDGIEAASVSFTSGWLEPQFPWLCRQRDVLAGSAPALDGHETVKFRPPRFRRYTLS